jgi:hypothetical protein
MLKELLKRGFVFSPDDPMGGDPPAADPTPGADPAATDPAAGDPPATPPATPPTQLTPEEYEQRAYNATMRANADSQAAYEARQAEARAATQQQQQRQQRWDPVSEAIDAVDLRTDMYEEILDSHPGLTPAARLEVKQNLRNFKTIEQLQAAKRSGMYKTIADAAYGKGVMNGTIKVGGTQAPSREPTTSEPPPTLAAGIANELAELEQTLGVKFTPQERAAFARGEM